MEAEHANSLQLSTSSARRRRGITLAGLFVALCVIAWRLMPPTPFAAIVASPQASACAARVCSDGTILVAFAESSDREPGKIEVWDVAAGRRNFSMDVVPGQSIAAKFSPDGRLLVVTPEKDAIALCDPTTGKAIERLDASRWRFSRDSRWLLYESTWAVEPTVHFWNVADRRLQFSVRAWSRDLFRDRDMIDSVTVADDGDSFAVVIFETDRSRYLVGSEKIVRFVQWWRIGSPNELLKEHSIEGDGAVAVAPNMGSFSAGIPANDGGAEAHRFVVRSMSTGAETWSTSLDSRPTRISYEHGGKLLSVLCVKTMSKVAVAEFLWATSDPPRLLAAIPMGEVIDLTPDGKRTWRWLLPAEMGQDVGIETVDVATDRKARYVAPGDRCFEDPLPDGAFSPDSRLFAIKKVFRARDLSLWTKLKKWLPGDQEPPEGPPEPGHVEIVRVWDVERERVALTVLDRNDFAFSKDGGFLVTFGGNRAEAWRVPFRPSFDRVLMVAAVAWLLAVAAWCGLRWLNSRLAAN